MDFSIQPDLGITEISHLPIQNEFVAVQEKSGLEMSGKAILSHQSQLYQHNCGESLVVRECSMSEVELKRLVNINFYRMSTRSLSWLSQLKVKTENTELIDKALNIIIDFTALESELNINRLLLVQS